MAVTVNFQAARVRLVVGSLNAVLLAGLGGAIGSICRYLLGGWVHALVPLSTFPYGTLVVNVSGCLVIGVIAGISDFRHALGPELRVFLMIGVLGGFTTFSSFAYETLALGRDAEFMRALVNVAAHVVLGLAAAWLGYAFTRG
jgi:CrcB protein